MNKKDNFLEKTLVGQPPHIRELALRILTTYLNPPNTNNALSSKGEKKIESLVDEAISKINKQ
jgi:hypothetical protein